MTRLFLASALVFLALPACDRPVQSDLPEIAARHRYRHVGECSSWLFSHKTGFAYCASPPFTAKYNELVAPPEKPKDGPVEMSALMARGGTVYGQVCAACHQADGQGLAGNFPPLAGAGEYYGDAQNMARIIVHGLQGEIVVRGQTYNGAMPAQGSLTDYEIAAVTTFVRHSWGNNDGMVTPDDVKAVR